VCAIQVGFYCVNACVWEHLMYCKTRGPPHISDCSLESLQKESCVFYVLHCVFRTSRSVPRWIHCVWSYSRRPRKSQGWEHLLKNHERVEIDFIRKAKLWFRTSTSGFTNKSASFSISDEFRISVGGSGWGVEKGAGPAAQKKNHFCIQNDKYMCIMM